MTECTQTTFDIQGLGRRQITARFDAPAITSDAAGALLRELDEKLHCRTPVGEISTSNLSGLASI